MSSELIAPSAGPRSAAAPRKRQRRGRASSYTSLTAHGEPMLWLTGGSLALCLMMILVLLGSIAYFGFRTFWPTPVVRTYLCDDAVYMGEATREETFRPEASVFDDLRKTVASRIRADLEAKDGPTSGALAMLDPEAVRSARAAVGADGRLPDALVTQLTDTVMARVKERADAAGGDSVRRSLRTGNFELTNTHFNWVDDFMVVKEDRPEWALVLERLEKGRFYGTPTAFLVDGKEVANEPAAVWAQFNDDHDAVRARWKQRVRLETDEIGAVRRTAKQAELSVKQAELDYGLDSPEYREASERAVEVNRQGDSETERIKVEVKKLNDENDRYQMRLATADGRDETIPIANIVRAYPANRLSLFDKIGVYFSRWKEFLLDRPRNVNMEGGVFPAIWGTAAMTLIMSVLVVPFGVLAALYLREYAKAGVIVSAVRIAVNNLAGVPSIVFGVFGLGFFCYVIGGGIDQLFFRASAAEGTPTFGTGGLLWASVTLALLTLPVVIVATEEALSAVPNSMREGSYACGASKWQTIRRIVLPRAMPGIMTGVILAMARGAGEVAPLMLVGVLKTAPELPVDGVFPYVHAQRSFMHLGFHIYDVGFQSPNSEAAKPMVYTTTLLLIGLIALLNVVAIWLRNRLRRRYVSAHF